jgi:TPR repeat protein
MNDMGVRYQKGTGIALDNVAAVGWFTLAAQHGLPAAFVNLGNCYDMGNGLKQDYAKAGQHYATAAAKEFPIAFVLLGQLFEQGHGTDVDLVKAYAMYKRAAASNVAVAVQAAEKLESKLSAKMKAAAEKLAADGKVIPGPTRGTGTVEAW